MLATLGHGPQNNVEVSHSVLIPVLEGCDTVTAANVNATIYRNLPLFARRISQSRDYLWQNDKLPKRFHHHNKWICAQRLTQNRSWREPSAPYQSALRAQLHCSSYHISWKEPLQQLNQSRAERDCRSPNRLSWVPSFWKKHAQFHHGPPKLQTRRNYFAWKSNMQLLVLYKTKQQRPKLSSPHQVLHKIR